MTSFQRAIALILGLTSLVFPPTTGAFIRYELTANNLRYKLHPYLFVILNTSEENDSIKTQD